MARILVFLGTIAAALAGVAALNWWMDPLGDRYHRRFLDQALSQPKPCFISWAVLGSRTWGDYKVDLFSRAHRDVVVVGSSRVGKISARPGESGFVNLGAPGMGADSLPPLFERLHSLQSGPLTVYVNVDPFWFGKAWHSETRFVPSYLRELKVLLSAQLAGETVRLLRYAPGAIRHPQRLQYTELERTPHGCLIDRGHAVRNKIGNAWAPDGSLYFWEDIFPNPSHLTRGLMILKQPGLAGDGLSKRQLAALVDALRLARSYGWRVVGVSLPFAPHSEHELIANPAYATVFKDFRAQIPRLFAQDGFPFLDLTNIGSVPCTAAEFTGDDEGHPDIACSARVRTKLDAAARSEPIPRPAR
ncbi:MAG: hypothetical protein QOK32_119 [Gaiellaceae bacterium]|nr:hypothetical protein [Gaiellaceae bacterium]